jgi:hypothetical protein
LGAPSSFSAWDIRVTAIRTSDGEIGWIDASVCLKRENVVAKTQRATSAANDRYYRLLQTAGFVNVDVFGCHLGQFSREHVLTSGDFEMLVVATKGQ